MLYATKVFYNFASNIKLKQNDNKTIKGLY